MAPHAHEVEIHGGDEDEVGDLEEGLAAAGGEAWDENDERDEEGEQDDFEGVECGGLLVGGWVLVGVGWWEQRDGWVGRSGRMICENRIERQENIRRKDEMMRSREKRIAEIDDRKEEED